MRSDMGLGAFEARVGRTLDSLDRQDFTRRIWHKDATVWRQGPDGAKVIDNRLGWLRVADDMRGRLDEINSFANEVKAAGFKHAVLMGMGGSSLSPEVSRLTFGVEPGYPDLMVLDSTVPAAVEQVDKEIEPETTLFIVSTKSGTTVETLSAYAYFYEKVRAKKDDKAGENFIAITDPGTPLEQMANDNRFRAKFINFPDIGGRYSALSYFGLIPAAVIGADVGLILDRASEMAKACSADVVTSDNPGIVLGTIMAELAMMGRDKMTMVLSPEIAGFGSWVEQLVAESTGKMGRGVVPVDGEYVGTPDKYGDDRLFVYMRVDGTSGDLDAKVDAIEQSGHPVVRIALRDVYDLGAEYFRWEMATGVASALLGVNAFDEPNVKESKDNTNRLLGEFEANGKLPEDKPVIVDSGIKLYCDEMLKSTLDGILAARKAEPSLKSYLAAFLDLYQPANYFALMGFVQGTKEIRGIFQCMRAHLRDAYDAATTLGYGPRFLHSTGQLHKGGPNSGLFIQFIADDPNDVAIPGKDYGFSVLKQAQALGDAGALQSKGRPLLRLHVGEDAQSGLNKILELIDQIVG